MTQPASYRARAEQLLRVALNDMGKRFFSSENLAAVHSDLLAVVRRDTGVQLAPQSLDQLLLFMVYVWGNPLPGEEAPTLVKLNARAVQLASAQVLSAVRDYVEYHEERARGFQPESRATMAARSEAPTFATGRNVVIEAEQRAPLFCFTSGM